MPNNVMTDLKRLFPSSTQADLLLRKVLNSKLGKRIDLPQDYVDFISYFGAGYFTVNGSFSLQIFDLITDSELQV